MSTCCVNNDDACFIAFQLSGTVLQLSVGVDFGVLLPGNAEGMLLHSRLKAMVTQGPTMGYAHCPCDWSAHVREV